MKKLLVIVGSTGTGKTNLAISLAKKFNGELVSADSRQIYKGMDIGTGKLPVNSKLKIKNSKLEKKSGYWLVDGVPIYLYDVIDPDKTFSVAEYQQLSYQKIEKIHAQDKLPILVGGTGLYVQAVVEGLKIPKVAPDAKLREKLEKKSLEALFADLEKIDTQSALKIDKQNKRRLVRALEVYYLSGEPFSKLKSKFKVEFDCLQIGLTAKREFLYERIDNHVERWFEEGFVDEVKRLLKKGYKESLPSMTSLGYRQVAMYLARKISLNETKQRVKWELHSYIRRQTTWFKRNGSIQWFDIDSREFRQRIEKTVQKWSLVAD